MMLPNPFATQLHVVEPGFTVTDAKTGEEFEVSETNAVARPGHIYLTQSHLNLLTAKVSA